MNGEKPKRVAVVSGAARGIGQAISRQFAEANVQVVGVDLGDLSQTGHNVTSTGTGWLAINGDVSSPDSVAAVAEAVLDRYGRCDILVNCAGIWPPKSFDELDYTEWKRVISVNLDSQFLMSKAFVPSMKANQWGRIINFTSDSILFPVPNYSAYKASKMGSIGLTRGMSIDLGKYGITVNAVSPALTPTPGTFEHGGRELLGVLDQVVQMQAIKRLSQPDDVAALVVFLASETAGFITGQTMISNGGISYL